MENLNIKNFEGLKADETTYFQNWGSKRPMVPILEEVDNQIGALPTKCTMNIISTTPLTSDIVTTNDGITPDYTHISEMDHIGKTKSSRHGISICGEGQCRGLVSGRWDSNGTGKLTFTSKHNGEESTIMIIADGKYDKFYGNVLGPYPCDNNDEVNKRYEGMLKMDENDIKMAKAKIGVRIEPYCKNNPNFKYIFNNEEITPIDMKYSNINSSDIKRWSKTYEVIYKGKRMKCTATVIDVHNFVKNGMIFKKNMVNDYDRVFNMNDECAGGFLSLGGVWAIMGGRSSWNLLGNKIGWHSTRTGERFFLEFDESDKEAVNIIKSDLFSESPEKSATPQSLLTMKDNLNKPVWGTMVDDIIKKLNEYKQTRIKEKKEENKSEYSEKEINKILDSMTGETIESIIVLLDANESRKCKSLRNDLQKRFGICKKDADTNNKNKAEMKLF